MPVLRLEADGIQEAFLKLQSKVQEQECTQSKVQLHLDLFVRDNTIVHSNDALYWGRFARLVEQCIRSSDVITIDNIQFLDRNAVFGQSDNQVSTDTAVSERFYLWVMPFIQSISFGYMNVLQTSAHWQQHEPILPSILTRVSRSLIFSPTEITSSMAIAIAQLLSSSKNGNPIHSLMFLDKPIIDAPSCEVILQALEGNPHLEDLVLTGSTLCEISLEAARAVGTCKSLHRIRIVYPPVSSRTVLNLAEGLRTCLSLRKLLVGNVGEPDNLNLPWDAFVELLKTYSYNLTVCCPAFTYKPGGCVPLHELDQFSPASRAQLREIHRRNEQIQMLHQQLFKAEHKTTPSSYCLPQVHLWPLTLQCIGSKPSLIYRFLRHGNLESFKDQLLLHAKP